jgi:hypothetical protein
MKFRYTEAALLLGLSKTRQAIECKKFALSRASFWSPERSAKHNRVNLRFADYASTEVKSLNTSASIVTNGGVEPPRDEAARSARTTYCRPMVAQPESRLLPHALAELLGKRDNDALRPADVG